MAQNRQMKEATGGTMYGPDINSCPAWFADAIAVIQSQISIEMSVINGRD